jgi:hypothetical protein
MYVMASGREGAKMADQAAPTYEVKIEVDEDELREFERLKETLGSPNLATALYNAVQLIKDLYELQGDGELRAVKDSGTFRFRLPARHHAG